MPCCPEEVGDASIKRKTLLGLLTSEFLELGCAELKPPNIDVISLSLLLPIKCTLRVVTYFPQRCGNCHYCITLTVVLVLVLRTAFADTRFPAQGCARILQDPGQVPRPRKHSQHNTGRHQVLCICQPNSLHWCQHAIQGPGMCTTLSYDTQEYIRRMK